MEEEMESLEEDKFNIKQEVSEELATDMSSGWWDSAGEGKGEEQG